MARGAITYPVTYTLLASGKHCRGTLSLNWDGPFVGWQMSSGQSNC